MRLTSRWGFIAAGIWFILTGLIAVFHISFTGEAIVMGIIAIIAGVLLFLEQ